MSKDVFTLKQVAQSIRKTIEGRYERTYWVKAEIYKMNLFPSGHAFPELVQRQDGGDLEDESIPNYKAV
jgi:exodeoxyribonuclease VII large subunit